MPPERRPMLLCNGRGHLVNLVLPAHLLARMPDCWTLRGICRGTIGRFEGAMGARCVHPRLVAHRSGLPSSPASSAAPSTSVRANRTMGPPCQSSSDCCGALDSVLARAIAGYLRAGHRANARSAGRLLWRYSSSHGWRTGAEPGGADRQVAEWTGSPRPRRSRACGKIAARAADARSVRRSQHGPG